MKQVDMKEKRSVIGGRWKCEVCGRKTLTIAAMHMHLGGAHQSCSKKLCGASGAKDWRYHWCL